MLDLGSTEFHISTAGLPKTEFESYTTRLFDKWEADVAGTIRLPDYSLLLTVEEGSIKGKGKVAAALAALYFGIGEYGDFISGLQQIRSQVAEAGDVLAKRAHEQLGFRVPKPKVRKQGGALSQLQRIFAKVQRQELSVEDAMSEAEAILGEEMSLEPDFAESLRRSLVQAPLSPKQLGRTFEAMAIEPLATEQKEGRSPRSPRPVYPPPLHLRAEVWRDSKNGNRKVRVTEL